MIFRTRDILVGQRTQIINASFAVIWRVWPDRAAGRFHVEKLVVQIRDADSDIPDDARQCLLPLVALEELHEKIVARPRRFLRGPSETAWPNG